MSIDDEIRRQNPWWRGKKAFDETIERDIEKRVKAELTEHIVTAITGMRRAGKTTLLKRMIEYLLKTVDPENIMYYSFDIEKCSVKDLLETYFKEILRTTPEEINDTYIFLDEVQKIDDWSDHVKAYHDSYKKIKFIITGSSSANIRKGGGESLVGRMNLSHLTTFSFREYLRFKGISVPEKDFDELSVPPNSKEIQAEFLSYLDCGGFPGLLELDETTRIERLKSILDLTLFRDVVEIFAIQRPELLEMIFRCISANSGSIVNYNKISKDHDAQYRTVKKYVEELEQSFLIEVSRRLENNVFKMYRKRPKIYSSDHAFCILEKTKEGLTAETVAYNHLKKLGETGYWKSKDTEVDILLKKESKSFAFEIKYRKEIRSSDKQGLNAIRESYPDLQLYLITKDKMEREGDIKMIPLWLLLLHI
ncbi:MAG: ATP-binding protein [Thermoplasmata archaeon]